MNRLSNPINTPEVFTPRHYSVAQLPTPLSIGRNRQNTHLQHDLNPSDDPQQCEQGYGAGMGSEPEELDVEASWGAQVNWDATRLHRFPEKEDNEYDNNDEDQPTGSNISENPIYSAYRSYVVLWEIPHGEENDWEDMNDENWQKVVRGGTLPSL